jgi:hypothetical protein
LHFNSDIKEELAMWKGKATFAIKKKGLLRKRGLWPNPK